MKLAQSQDADPGERVKTLKEVGDTSLYVSGFFAESLTRSLVDVDYWRTVIGDHRSILEAVEAERRRIERNLHDGVQQQLVAIGLDLGIAARHVDDDPARTRDVRDKLQRLLDSGLTTFKVARMAELVRIV